MPVSENPDQWCSRYQGPAAALSAPSQTLRASDASVEHDHDQSTTAPGVTTAVEAGTASAGGLASTINITHQRRVWSRRAASWDHGDNPGLAKVVGAVVAAASPSPSSVVLDMGCGTGQLTIPLARIAARVVAVDVSRSMIDLLHTNADKAGVHNIEAHVGAIEAMNLPAASIDLAVSNYALHHLRDPDKVRLLSATAKWLKPGGRIVIGDMMFGRGLNARDRAIIKSKVAALVKRGPGGLWRLAKNVGRFTFRLQERPVAMETWVRMLQDAGFTKVASTPVVAEAGIVSAEKPETTRP